MRVWPVGLGVDMAVAAVAALEAEVDQRHVAAAGVELIDENGGGLGGMSLGGPENPLELRTAKSFISCNVGKPNSTGQKTFVFGTNSGYRPATNGDGYVTQAEAGSSLSAC